ncbi:aspartyl/asparaginyl beta-hydroxylase domain-containing protein [Pseudidiomarina sp. GXY010]|uniref:Aspartyl/asparaginyl beta-hydroxylase domain-containing protein n=1 Tax=Pseudidiomarina fusca TaxID=2965078 RepID=A0ABU3KWP5_9GAMM|nr:aspartyl/asparaginyl beta-hydroxylase domain-containing protein [Pseudidiomarina sp. GXY010]MDT7525358.1 aspartyl/asparaginyl beta-hydroxylase domain-containing protein [Pseudidiomarina sp. GXY010]
MTNAVTTAELQQQLVTASEQGDLLQAIGLLERLIQAEPKQVGYHEQLGQALRQYCDSEAKQQQLTGLVEQQPYAFTTRLLVARFAEMLGQPEAAFLHYSQAINTAQSLGFWLNDASTAPWCRPFVQHALKVSAQQRIAQGQQWISELQRDYEQQDLARVIKAVRMHTGEIAVEHHDKRQLPSYFYVPDLPVAPQFPREAMPFIDEYEAAAAGIQADLHRVLETQAEFPRFQYQGGEEQLTEGGSWDAFFFYRHGNAFTENLAQCPTTASVLDSLPLCRIPQHSPEVCFSILRPGAHILPHRGVTNLRSVLHLGLDIPTDCALHLPDITEIHWDEGKAFAFDDTYLHEAWNRSDRTRIVLLADIWNPYLTEVERAALTDVMVKLGEFNRAVKAVA